MGPDNHVDHGILDSTGCLQAPARVLPGGPWHHASIINNDLIGFDRGASKILERHLINVIELFNPCLWEDGACEPVSLKCHDVSSLSGLRMS